MLVHHDAAVVGLQFSPDGSRLVTATTDDGITVWDVASGIPIPLRTYPGPGNGVTAVLLLPDGRQLFEAVVAFGESALVDLQTERETTTFAMIQAQCAAWVPGGRGILIASWDAHLCGAAQLLDRHDLHVCRTYQTDIEGMIGRVAVSADGARFLAAQACFSAATGSASDDRAFLFETDTGALVQPFCGPPTLHDLTFAPGEQYIVGCADSGLWWWDAQTADVVDQYREPHGSIAHLAVAPARAPDPHLLAGGCDDGTVVVWHWPDLREWWRFHDHTGRVNQITFAPDGHLVASAGEDGVVSLRQLDR